MVSDRGQAITLEAFTAALLLISGIIFALQATAITPLTASTSSQHIENQQTQVAAGLLDSAAENGSLRTAVLNWNDSKGSFADVGDRGYYAHSGPPGTTFGSMLNRTFRDQGIAFNVNVIYVTTTDQYRSEKMVHFGTPSDNAVSVRRTLTLYDDDALTGPTGGTLANTSSYFFSDTAPDSNIYAVIEVEVVVWRM